MNTVIRALFVCSILLSTSLTSLAETFTYDANGNLVQDGVHCYQYNAANRLENVTNCAGTNIARYWYDYTGRKVKSVANGTATYYPFPGTESLVNGSRLENTTYFYLYGELIARKDSAGMHYYHGDQLGSTSVIIDASGNLEEKTKYYPFGGTRSGGTKTKYLFNGRELTAATGLYYYGARWYNPVPMHFIQPDSLIQDPFNPQSLNRYSYTENNPLNYVDPSGHGKVGWVTKFAVGVFKYGSIGMGVMAIESDFKDLVGRMAHASNSANEKGLANWDTACAVAEVGTKAFEIGIAGKSDLDDAAGLIKGGGKAIGFVEKANKLEHLNDARQFLKTYNLGAKADAGITVLGKTGKYDTEAYSNANRLIYSGDVFKSMDSDTALAMNHAFLDEAIARGDKFEFASDPFETLDQKGFSYFKDELNYLMDKGYTITEKGAQKL